MKKTETPNNNKFSCPHFIILNGFKNQRFQFVRVLQIQKRQKKGAIVPPVTFAMTSGTDTSNSFYYHLKLKKKKKKTLENKALFIRNTLNLNCNIGKL